MYYYFDYQFIQSISIRYIYSTHDILTAELTMRLWSLHPRYLDAKGLVACWREGLLARKVLQGNTRGYRNHPQLMRFKAQTDPTAALDQYLSAILEEAVIRGYNFNAGKIYPTLSSMRIPVTDGQLAYELRHLRAKLAQRDATRYQQLTQITTPLPNPIFWVVRGDIEPWEKYPRDIEF